MPSPLEARQIVRKRLRDDFDFYAERAPNPHQDSRNRPPQTERSPAPLLDTVNAQWKREGKVRVIILKARQMGLSTAVGGFLYFGRVRTAPKRRSL
jgi:hypothetical protein